PSFQPDSLQVVVRFLQRLQQSFRFARNLYFPDDPACIVHNAEARLLDRHVQSSKMVHAALLLLMLEAVRGPRFTISLKRSTPTLQLSSRTAGQYPIFLPCVDGSWLASQNFTSRRWSVQPCVRPVSAVRMTAGHSALRGSGPGQKPAFDNALAHVGCPDRRIDRLYITCCSPSQPSHHAGFSS